MLKCIYVFLLFVSLPLSSAETEDKPKVLSTHRIAVASGRYLSVFEFEGHTYLYLSNSWNSSGDNFLHDPNCVCQKGEKKHEG